MNGRKKIVLGVSALCIVWISVRFARPQGMATGTSVAIPSRPLPRGLKAPTIQFEDVGDRAGLAVKDLSGVETNKQYIVETIGSGVAILDYDNDGLPDIFLVNGG